MSIAETDVPTSKPGIRVLSLDGGDFRGLSSLILLRVLMDRISVKENASAALRPSNYFDFIIGTGTGGLSALFLGRLRMTVDEAINAYLLVGDKCFKRSSVPLFQRLQRKETLFDGDSVTRVIGDIVQKFVGDRDTLLKDPPEVVGRFCRTAVLATSSADASAPPSVFRSYRTRIEPASTHSIDQAARATIATAGAFPPISIGSPPIQFVNAGVAGYNNPGEVALDEVTRVQPEAKITCLISLGTGLQNIVRVGETSEDVIHVSRRLVEDCEKVHDRLRQRSLRDGLSYYRFNVTNGLDGADIKEWDEKTSGFITDVTEGYARKPDVGVFLNSCASILTGNALADSISQEDYEARSLSLLNTIKDDVLAEKISAWLKPPDSSSSYNDACRKHQEGTGAWFIDGECFSKWKRDRASFLCVYGKPGSGKTILGSSIITHIAAVCDGDTSRAYAYFFFDGRDAQSTLQRHDGFIRSLIQQLVDQWDGIPSTLAQLYGKGHRQPSTYTLEDTLHHMIGGFIHTYVIVDSLDECAERQGLLTWIKKIMRGKVGALHLLCTSRPEEEIEADLACPRENRIDLDEEHVDSDIKMFIDWKIQMEPRLNRWDGGVRMKIKEKLIEKAEGTFRWVALQLEELRKCPNKAGLYAQLDRLPKDLDETYNRILINIDEQYRRDAVIFLQWIAFSARPLTLQEIAETAAFDHDPEDGPTYNPDLVYPVPGDVFIACSSLIVKSGVTSTFTHEMNIRWPRMHWTDDMRTTVKLSHFSVKEYLVSERIRNGTAAGFSINQEVTHSLISQRCIAYLLRFDSLESIDESTIESLPLAEYAADKWAFHARLGSNDSQPVARKLIIKLLQPGSPPLLNWIRLWDPDIIPYNIFPRKSLKSTAEPLYYASQLGFLESSRKLLENGASADAKGKKHHKNEGIQGHDNALQAACFEGHRDIVHMLLEKGADVNTQGGRYGNALQAASQGGHELIVRLLMEKGAEVNVQGGWYGNALQAASHSGHDGVVRLLIEKGADVNAQGGHYGNALQAASEGGHDLIVRLLMERGADVNAQGGEYGNVLQAASHGGHQLIVRLLIETGAEVNAQGGRYHNVLQAASQRGHELIVRLLIEEGADVNAQGGRFGNALQAASHGGHELVVRLLVEKGADVNMQGGEYGCALQAASLGGHDLIVRLLLEKGADVNAQGGSHGNALHAASLGGHEALVGLLIEKGAEVNAQGGRFGNALQAATYGGHQLIARLLIEKGANVNMQAGEYGSALQAASRGGDDALVGLLIEKGADINLNVQVSRFGNALSAASHGGHEALVRLFMEKGADVNVQGGDFGHVLQAASHGVFREAIIKFLIEKGANVNAQGGSYGTALQAASSIGHETAVRLLLENHAEVNIQGGYYGNALQAASLEGKKSLVMLLLDKGADVNAQGGSYGNALAAASSEDHEEIVKLLLQEGADVNRYEGQENSALMVASSNGHESIVKLLLEHGANVNAPEGSPINALVSASWNGHEPVVKLLLEHGADAKSQGEALEVAMSEGYDGIVQLLLDHGAIMPSDVSESG